MHNQIPLIHMFSVNLLLPKTSSVNVTFLDETTKTFSHLIFVVIQYNIISFKTREHLRFLVIEKHIFQTKKPRLAI